MPDEQTDVISNSYATYYSVISSLRKTGKGLCIHLVNICASHNKKLGGSNVCVLSKQMKNDTSFGSEEKETKLKCMNYGLPLCYIGWFFVVSSGTFVDVSKIGWIQMCIYRYIVWKFKINYVSNILCLINR